MTMTVEKQQQMEHRTTLMAQPGMGEDHG